MSYKVIGRSCRVYERFMPTLAPSFSALFLRHSRDEVNYSSRKIHLHRMPLFPAGFQGCSRSGLSLFGGVWRSVRWGEGLLARTALSAARTMASGAVSANAHSECR